MPEEALEHADAVVCGEGETSWRRICDQMLTNPDLVSGMYCDPAPDLATLPQPRMDLMKLGRHQSFYYPLMASRGCPESCSFCFAKRMTHGYRTYPLAHVIEQVRRRPRWVRGMYFVDDNLAGDVEYTRELFRELARYKVPFGMQVRHEFSKNPDDLRLAREAGCVLVSSGYESVNQKSLDKTGKRANADCYKEIIQNIQKAGMIASGNWMFGFDWDTPDVFRETWEFLQDSRIYHCAFTTEIPFPGTPTYRRYEREGRILSTRYEDYIGKDKVVVKPMQMSPEELRRGIRWLTLQYYSVRHRHRLFREALRIPGFMPVFRGFSRKPTLLFLNYFQVFLYTYRMVPLLRRLYDGLVPYVKHRFVLDNLRRTNFWSQPFAPAEAGPAPALATKSPFKDRSGWMRPGGCQLDTEAPPARGPLSRASPAHSDFMR